eukprot:tig00020563_g11227.t1
METFTQLAKNLRDLNAMAGDGSSAVVHRAGARRLRAVDPILLTIYSNGMILGSASFRPYSEASCGAAMADLLDGYFPYELKEQYPDGVPIKLVDNTHQEYEAPFQPFSGEGRALVSRAEDRASPAGAHPVLAAAISRQAAAGAIADAPSSSSSSSVPPHAPASSSFPVPTAPAAPHPHPPPGPASASASAPAPAPSSAAPPYPPRASVADPNAPLAARLRDVDSLKDPNRPMERNEFLNRLPKNVVRNGRVVSVRDDIDSLLKGREPPAAGGEDGGVIVIETPTLKLIRDAAGKEPSPSEGQERPSSAHLRTPRDIATLRVKSDDGKRTFLLKLRADDTIGALREHLQRQRPKDAPDFEIRTAFPNQAYADPKQTLREAGLVPNAILVLRPLAMGLGLPAPKG